MLLSLKFPDKRTPPESLAGLLWRMLPLSIAFIYVQPLPDLRPPHLRQTEFTINIS